MSNKTEMSQEEKKQFVIDAYGNFPLRLVIHLSRDANGKYSMFFSPVKSTAKIQNIRFSQLKRISLDGSISTPLDVGDFDSFESLEKRMDELADRWIGGDKQ